MPQATADLLAFDRASVRSIDADGRLQVAVSHISKATVNPYMGNEIPGWEALGLDGARIYMLLRDPAELAKGAETFNNLPVLDCHVPFHVNDISKLKKHVIGSTGTDAAFNAPYLDNSLVVWDNIAIAGIGTGDQKEISCCYRYTPVMIAGVYEGQPYDGVMTEIIGNHVAIVPVGRAGSDVVVGDANPFLTEFDMKKTSRLAIAVATAARMQLAPMLAADAALPDLTPIVGLPKRKTLDADLTRIGAALAVSLKGKLAADKAFDATAFANTVKLAADGEPDDEMVAADEDDDLDDEAYEKKHGKKREKANDNPPDFEGKPKDPAAMDSAGVAAAIKLASDAQTKAFQELRVAERIVAPLLGEVTGDNAASVYKLALDHATINVDGVHPSAYKALVEQHIANRNHKPAPMAQDAGSTSDFTAAFPGARIPGSV